MCWLVDKNVARSLQEPNSVIFLGIEFANLVFPATLQNISSQVIRINCTTYKESG